MKSLLRLVPTVVGFVKLILLAKNKRYYKAYGELGGQLIETGEAYFQVGSWALKSLADGNLSDSERAGLIDAVKATKIHTNAVFDSILRNLGGEVTVATVSNTYAVLSLKTPMERN